MALTPKFNNRSDLQGLIFIDSCCSIKINVEMHSFETYNFEKSSKLHFSPLLEKYRTDVKSYPDSYTPFPHLDYTKLNKNIKASIKSLRTEYVLVIYPNNNLLKNNLECFFKLIQPENPFIDISDKFGKYDKELSITNSTNVNNYYLNVIDSIDEPIKSLLIVDDVYNKGRTLDILLNRLSEKEYINSDTEVNYVCIYRPELPLLNVPKNFLETFSPID